MSEYVSINTSIPEILSAANDLVLKGAELQSAMAPLLADITRSEGTAIWGNDEFSGKFLGNYHGDDNTSESVKTLMDGSKSIGATTQNIGNVVVNTMFNYADTDAGSASDIDGTAA